MGNRILDKYGTTIFAVISDLARAHDAVNLGQGFPDGNGPDDVRRAAAVALDEESNQYPPMMGIPALRRAVAEHDRRFYGLDIDAASEVMVTSGATEALAACLLGSLNPGDEVVVFEPFYDSYVPVIELAGAVPRYVRLSPPDWSLDRDALADAFSDKTRAVVLNSPMNPSGKVFSEDELDAIAEKIVEHDAIAICDEVYEHLTFDGTRHVPLMTRSGMRERCVRIGSAGKSFSLTGWKVGYVTGSASLLAPMARAHQFLTFTTPPNLQHGVAYGLGKSDDYYVELRQSMQERRNLLRAGLAEIGFEVASCEGTYFLNADYSSLSELDDLDFCKHLIRDVGVAAIPTSAFYRDHPGTRVVRFCFCKEEATLSKALDRLQTHFR